MCLIIAKHHNNLTPIHESIIDYAGLHNPDAFGITARNPETGETYWRRSLNVNNAVRLIRAAEDFGFDFIAHWRYATTGATTIANCHPFKIHPAGVYMAHNGHISELAYLKSEQSDTAALASMLANDLADTPADIIRETLEDWLSHNRRLLANQKLAFIGGPIDKPLIYNATLGGLDTSGAWYSDPSFAEYATTLQMAETFDTIDPDDPGDYYLDDLDNLTEDYNIWN
jgi:predicted glutamine amidotransferase